MPFKFIFVSFVNFLSPSLTSKNLFGLLSEESGISNVGFPISTFISPILPVFIPKLYPTLFLISLFIFIFISFISFISAFSLLILFGNKDGILKLNLCSIIGKSLSFDLFVFGSYLSKLNFFLFFWKKSTSGCNLLKSGKIYSISFLKVKNVFSFKLYS